MKKILAMLLVLVLALSFAACNKDKDEDEKDDATTVAEEVKENKEDKEDKEDIGDVLVDDSNDVTKAPGKPVTGTSNDEADVKAAAENYVDILFISDTSDVDDLDAAQSFIFNGYFKEAYGTAEFNEEFEEFVGMDVETCLYYYEIDPSSQYATSWICATYVAVSVLGSLDDIANADTIEIISTDVTLDDEVSAQAELVASELANEMGVSLAGAPKFSGVADATVDILVTTLDGTQVVKTVELGLLKEDGQWKVIPLN